MLTVEQLSALLTRHSGKSVTAAQIRQDLKAGAPKQKSGGVHLVEYTAWLCREYAADARGH